MHHIQRPLHVAARSGEAVKELLDLAVSRSQAHGAVALPAREIIHEPQMLAATKYWDALLCLEESPEQRVELLDELLGTKMDANMYTTTQTLQELITTQKTDQDANMLAL